MTEIDVPPSPAFISIDEFPYPGVRVLIISFTWIHLSPGSHGGGDVSSLWLPWWFGGAM